MQLQQLHHLFLKLCFISILYCYILTINVVFCFITIHFIKLEPHFKLVWQDIK